MTRKPWWSPRMLEPRTAAKAVGSVLELHGISDQVRAGRLLTEWADLVGPKIAQHTRPLEVRDRLVTVEVMSSAWLNELEVLRLQILAGLVARFGEPRVFDDLKFRLAGRYHRDSMQLRGRRLPPKSARPLPPPATGAARERIVREAANVEDVELRELIARVRITHDK